MERTQNSSQFLPQGPALSCRLRIGVMGAALCTPEIERLAEEVGRMIAEHQAVLISGGRSGVMEAASRGAKLAGGLTIGILPGESADEANRYVDLPIATGLGNARNVVNILSSQVIIAISGGYGTLSEIALALKAGRPVVGLRTWSLTTTPAPKSLERLFLSVQTPKEAVETAVRLSTII